MTDTNKPLNSLGDWEDFVVARYPEAGRPANKYEKEFRDYDNPARDTVREFYRLNHTHHTLEFSPREEGGVRRAHTHGDGRVGGL